MNREAAFTPLPEFYRNICAVLTQNNLKAALSGRAYAYKGEGLLRRNLALTGQPEEAVPAPLHPAMKGEA